MGLRLSDPADRLTQALASPGGAYAYTLDPADNLLAQQSPTGTTSSTVNALNQLVQRSGQPFTHDAAGNLTGDGTRTYAWVFFEAEVESDVVFFQLVAGDECACSLVE